VERADGIVGTYAVFRCAFNGLAGLDGRSVSLVPRPCRRLAKLGALCVALACALSLGSGASLASASKGIIGTFGSTGREPGQFKAPRGVAVNDSTGDVYVVDSTEDAVEVFDADGDYLSRFEYRSLAGSEGVAIDQSTGTVYVTARDPDRIDVFNAAGVFEGAFGSEGSGAGELGAEIGYLAVNPSNGDVVVADAPNRRVDEFSVTVTLGVVSGAAFVRAIGWGVISNADDELQACTTATGCVAGLEGAGAGEFGADGPTRVAADSSGAIYAVDPSNSRVEKFAADGSSAETFAAAQLSGTLSPGDVAVEQGTNDVYVTKPVANAVSGELEQRVFEFDTTEMPNGTPDGIGAKIPSDKGLAVSSFNGDIYLTSEVPDNHVTVLNTIDPTSVGAMDVKDTSATLQAQINPGGTETEYRFEYGTSTSYGANVSGSAGAGVGIVPVSVHLQNLEPGITYYFRVRVVATNSSLETDYSPDHTFTTQVASEFALPEGRAWEMVSPPDKHGITIEAITQEGGLIQASEDGGAITYVTHGPIGAEEPKGNPAYAWTQILSTRSPEGDWVSQDIATPHETPILETPIGDPTEYKFFSADLSLGLVEPLVNPAITEQTMDLREADGAYKPLLTSSNVPSVSAFGNAVKFEDATPELSNAVLSSEVALTPPPVALNKSLYEWSANEPATEQVQLVSVLPGPGEQPAASPTLGGEEGLDVRHAISNNGQRIVWNAERHLYMRDMARRETVEVDDLQGGSNSGSARIGPVFQTASSNGSKVFFTDEQPLTRGSTATYENPDLYVFEVTSGSGEPLAGRLTDLTVGSNLDEDADVQGSLPGASEGENESESYVYFVAHGVLGSGENGQHETAMAGGDNLYVRHYNGSEWEGPTFIATFSSEDGPDWAEELTHMTSRVSPDGRYLAFMSDRPLTGYDNVDANSGLPDEEVFLYDATSGQLACASCEPTGAKPVGVFDPTSESESTLLVDRRGVWAGRWLAGSIPTWTSVDLVRAFYQSRYLSNSGRLFFNSPDALVPADVNGKEDVYEYEPEGVGSCGASSETFSEKSGGCVDLISSGTSSEESAFLDASAGGGDVFFLTASELVPQDVDAAFDVYDAHECTGESPCPVTSAVVPPACTTTDSCRAAPSPQPSVFGAPPSATFSGAGDLAPTVTKPATRSLTRTQKLSKALKACRKKKNKRKRAVCEKQAQKSYGARASRAGKSRAANTSKRGKR
jgi:DNA-binding beta-propeller fold protein YncE